MTYEARKICNFVLTNFDADQYDLTNLRINKLLFLVHGWSFGRSDSGLVKNHFEAWRHGPVVRVVFDTFKKFENRRITSLAEHLDYAIGDVRPITFEDIVEKDRKLIRNIVIHYAKYSTNELVGMLHERGGPWDKIYHSFESGERRNARIPEKMIRTHFRSLSGDKTHH